MFKASLKGLKKSFGNSFKTKDNERIEALPVFSEMTSPPVVLDEHNNTVFSMSFSTPNESTPASQLASASYDGTTRIWDLNRCLTKSKKRCKHVLKGNFGGVWSCTYSPDLPALITGCAKGTVCVFDMSQKYQMVSRTLQAHGAQAVFSTAVTSGGLFATGGGDNGLKVWRMSSLFTLQGTDMNKEVVKLQDFEGHAGDVVACAFSPPSSRGSLQVASGSEDKHIRLWDVEQGECLQTVIGHTAEVCCVQYSPSGDLLASGSSDRTTRLCDPRQRHRCIQTLEGQTASIYSLAFNRGGTYATLATASQDGTVLLWDMRMWRCCRRLADHSGEVVCCAYSYDGTMLATGSADMSLRLYRTRDMAPSSMDYIELEAPPKATEAGASRTPKSSKPQSSNWAPGVTESAPLMMEVMSEASQAPKPATRSQLAAVGEGNRGHGAGGVRDTEEEHMTKLLARFYHIYKPEKVATAGNLANAFITRGGGRTEMEALNRDLKNVYGADLSALGVSPDDEDIQWLILKQESGPNSSIDSCVSRDRSDHTAGRTIANDTTPYTPGLTSSAADTPFDTLDLRDSQEAADSVEWGSAPYDEKSTSMGIGAMQQSLLHITPAPAPADDGFESLGGGFSEVAAFEVPAAPPRSRTATFSM